MGEEREEEMNQKIYAGRSIETEALSREVLVHGAMLYQCECCGRMFQMWLEKGLEDRKYDNANPGYHKPVPFCIGCLCGGVAKHIAWQNDIHLDEYRPLKESENYFENSPESTCGIAHFRNDSEFAIQELPEFKELKRLFENDEELKRLFETEREESIDNAFKRIEEDSEDDPYGLAHITTSTLKAELRRRKRWK